jgi:hypothetical protein
MTHLAWIPLAALVATACNGDRVLPLAPTPINPTAASGTSGGPALTTGRAIAIGQRVSDSVQLSDPACFYNWDATGRCRQFDVTPAVAGTLTVTLRWEGPTRGFYDPDVFLVTPDNGWLNTMDTTWPEKHLSRTVTAGTLYRIVVMSYGQALDFELIAELQP